MTFTFNMKKKINFGYLFVLVNSSSEKELLLKANCYYSNKSAIDKKILIALQI